MVRAFWIGLAFWFALSGAAANAAPERIVSINHCTDQLLLTLAPRERITALSNLATRPYLSTLWREAQGIPQVRASAEEVLSLQPDLVLAQAYRARPTVRLLERFGVPVLKLPPAKDFTDVREQIRQVAEAIGEPERGAAVLAALDRELAQLVVTPSRTGAYYRQSGYSYGAGTLEDTIMQAANMDNTARATGLQGIGYLPLERLLIERPDWLITSDYKRDVPTLGSRMLRHPALHGIPAGEFVLPSHLFSCGGDWNVQAVHLLAALPPVR